MHPKCFVTFLVAGQLMMTPDSSKNLDVGHVPKSTSYITCKLVLKWSLALEIAQFGIQNDSTMRTVRKSTWSYAVSTNKVSFNPIK